jgi:uncharacterized protein YbcI
MAKVHYDRLKKTYSKQIRAGDFSGVMNDIIANNHQSIQNAVARVKVDEMNRAAVKVRRSSTKQLVVPTLEEVLPKRSVFIRKGQEQGRLMTDTLRDKLTKDLRESVAEFLKTGQGSMQYKKGEKRGTINPKLVAQFRNKITDTFAGYTKPGATGVPPNIETIARTEVRSAIDDIKHTFNTRLQERNPGRIQIVKTWVHHPSLSKEPRENHAILNGQTIPIDAHFSVPRTQWVKGRGLSITGTTLMLHPHDPSAPVDQIASCNCECTYETRIL